MRMGERKGRVYNEYTIKASLGLKLHILYLSHHYVR